MEHTFTAHNLADLDAIAEQIFEQCKDDTIFAFYGDMGAGKTTLISALCRYKQVIDRVNSPTFAIINEYVCATSEPIYHFDFYRIKDIEEAYSFGYETYFDSGDICFIEWPQLVDPLLPEDYVSVIINVNDNDSRTITIKK